jgi:uncharacterized membrane protein (DUF373 family)
MDMLEFVGKFEKFFYGALIVLLMIVLVFALIELVWAIITTVNYPTAEFFQSAALVEELGAFLLVLIGIELLDTMMEYFRENAIHVEIVVLLAIIAIARKVILLNPSQTTGLDLIGIGIVIIGLAGAYYLIRKAGITFGPKGLQRNE